MDSQNIILRHLLLAVECRYIIITLTSLGFIFIYTLATIEQRKCKWFWFWSVEFFAYLHIFSLFLFIINRDLDYAAILALLLIFLHSLRSMRDFYLCIKKHCKIFESTVTWK